MRATSLWRAPRMIWKTGLSPSAELYGDLLGEVSMYRIVEEQKGGPNLFIIAFPVDGPMSSYFQMDNY